jgi:hypothetical protein
MGGLSPNLGCFFERPMEDDERRALEMLAAAENGCADALLVGYGFKLEMILGMVGAGLLTATAERAAVAGHAVEVTRMRITEAGRQALAEQQG